MSNLRQAAEQALEALENHTAIKHPQQIHYRDAAIEALRAALKNEFGPDWDAMAVMVEEQQRMAKELASANSRLHELAVYCAGMEAKTVRPTPPLYRGGYIEGVMAERQRIVNLLMIQHEAAKGAHNYWHVAAQLIQADVASDT